jgi:acyl-coenzyme A synthetase/AMP-(fatty) acid ligase
VSAVVESGDALRPRRLSLFAGDDLERCLLWQGARAVSVREFLAEAHALATLLPKARYMVNLCADRHRFLVAFCAAAIAGQTNLLPASRAPQAVDEVMHAYVDSYAFADTALQPAPPQLFVFPQCINVDNASIAIPAIAADHVIAVGFTSGSTGQPKANPKTWGNFCASTALNAGLLCAELPPNIVATVPPQHMYGMELSVLLPLRCGAIHAGQPFFPADIAHALCEIPAPRLLVTTPVHLRALLRESPAMPALAGIVSATAPLDAELAAAAEQRFATRVIEVFGSTETCVIAHRRAAHENSWHLYPGITLQPQPDGTLVSAAHLPAATLLQDIVELLPSQQFILRGRNSDLLEIAGKRASLADLGRRLLAIPGVEDGVVFALDADASGICRLAALVVAPDLDEARILATLRQAIDPVFLPRPLRRVAALPRNGAGKLPREALLQALKA